MRLVPGFLKSVVQVLKFKLLSSVKHEKLYDALEERGHIVPNSDKNIIGGFNILLLFHLSVLVILPSVVSL